MTRTQPQTTSQESADGLVGTIWRDSLWHTFTVTSARIDTTDPGREVVLRGTVTGCTPGLCLFSHDGMTDTKVTTLHQVRAGRIHAYTRQDVWDADPNRAPEPVVTDDERERGLAAWALFDDGSATTSAAHVVNAGLPTGDTYR
jgi:hypothetical protein